MNLEFKGISGRARFFDRAGRYLISVGGIGIIAAVLGIFVFILKETLPLFQAPEVEELGRLEVEGGAEILALGTDPYREIIYLVRPEGVDFLHLKKGEMLRRERPAELAGRAIVSVSTSAADGTLGLGLDGGQILPAKIEFELDYLGNQRQVRPVFTSEDSFILDPEGERITRLALRQDGEGRLVAMGITDSGRLLVTVRQQEQGLLGAEKIEQGIYELKAELCPNPQVVLLDRMGRYGLVGTNQGNICEWHIGGTEEKPMLAGTFAAAAPGTPITALEFILGDASLAVGDGEGQVSGLRLPRLESVPPFAVYTL